MKRTPRLRFAPIVRVSTERQENRKSSLKVQTKQIKQYVELLNGVIPKHCWQYSGQEHATPDYERAKLDKLLSDSGRDIFDAVIVADTSRWSRDNEKNKAGIKILKGNDIRFFSGTMELDLHNPEHNFILGMTAEIGEFQAKQRNQKSILSRINNARENKPATGKLPYGRTYDRKAERWGIDPVKKECIQQAAARYLNGESIVAIADTLNMNFSNLWKILTKRSGTEWSCRFRYEKIDETVILKVPKLLDQATIEAIHEQGRANKTYTHGEIKHRYLLSRMIFCSKCGYALFGYTNHNGRRYYRHPRHRKQNCTFTRFVPAAELESGVLLQLIRTFGDPELVERAIKDATPDLNKVDGFVKEQTRLTNDLKRIITGKDHIIDMVAEGTISKSEVKRKMDKLRKQEQSIRDRLLVIEAELSNVPDPQRVKRLSKLGRQVVKNATQNRPKAIFEKSYEWKRKLVEYAFAGRNAQQERFGVYIQQADDVEQPWQFEIRGTLETTLLALPLSDEYLIEMFKLDFEFQDVPEELKKIRANITNFVRHCIITSLP